MARADKFELLDEVPPERQVYQGRKIGQRHLNIGMGGQLELPEHMLRAAPRSRVLVQFEAVYDSTKIKFDQKHGGAIEDSVIVMDTDTFEIKSITAPVPEPIQSTIDEAAGEGDGNATVTPIGGGE